VKVVDLDNGVRLDMPAVPFGGVAMWTIMEVGGNHLAVGHTTTSKLGHTIHDHQGEADG
jgi:hypothetical protein